MNTINVHVCMPTEDSVAIHSNTHSHQISHGVTTFDGNRRTNMVLPWIFVLVCLLNNPSLLLVNAGCKTPNGTPVCCRGRQAACSSFMYGNNSDTTSSYQPYRLENRPLLNELTSLKTCFCDEHCTSTGDCCPDYRDVCRKPIVHCEVSPWGPWGSCDRACGRGVRIRRRVVTTPALNGGKHCPVLQETASCEGYQCGTKRVGRSGSVMVPFLHRAQSEVAHLLPNHGDVLQMIRQWHMRWDVRRKLYLGRLIKQNKTEQPEPEPYCAVYAITQRSQACWLQKPSTRDGRDWNNYEFHQNRAPYMWAQGNRAGDQNWYWQRRYRRNAPPSPYWNTYAFMRNVEWDTTESWSRAWSSRISQLAEGQQICVTCYPGYMREDHGLRCSGTGLMNVETRWRALRTDDCHGKFRMVSMPQRGCTCGKGSASFIFV